MKYTIEFRYGLKYIEKEIEGRVPGVGETVWLDLDFHTGVFVVTNVITDLTCSDPIYIVALKEKR